MKALFETPVLRPLRGDAGWTLPQPWAVRRGPTIRFKGQWDSLPAPGEIARCEIKVFSPLNETVRKTVLEIWPCEEEDSEGLPVARLIATKTRSTGMGGSTICYVDPLPGGFVIPIGKNETPSGGHGLRFWLVVGGAAIDVRKTSNSGRHTVAREEIS